MPDTATLSSDGAAPCGRVLHLVACLAHTWGQQHLDGKAISANFLYPENRATSDCGSDRNVQDCVDSEIFGSNAG